MHPSKRHDGQTITIRAIPGSADEGMELIGEYVHKPRSQAFWFNPSGRVKHPQNKHCCLFMRDEWEVVV